MCHSYSTRTFQGLPERVADVREYIRRVVGDVDGVDDVELVASELAANAIQHSASGSPGGRFVVQVVEFSDAWHIRVDDQGGLTHLGPEDAEDTDEAGRGLQVVEALCRAWGVIENSAGKTVWAEITYPADDIAGEFYEDDVERVRDELALSTVGGSKPDTAVGDLDLLPWRALYAGDEAHTGSESRAS